jgi:4-hydroxy-3-methylbut-2-en-1-yl diphosphate synthase IspG/GcpE
MKNSYRKQQQAVTLFRQFTAAKKRAEILPLIRICKERKIAMRIGTNHGSLSERLLNRYGRLRLQAW